MEDYASNKQPALDWHTLNSYKRKHKKYEKPGKSLAEAEDGAWELTNKKIEKKLGQ